MKCRYCGKDFPYVIHHEHSCSKFHKMRDEIVKLYVGQSMSGTDVATELGLPRSGLFDFLRTEGIVRTSSESGMAGHRRYPESFRHTEETRKILREKHLDFMKRNPLMTPWRHQTSYPEELFASGLTWSGLTEAYLIEREKCFFPYYVDFAFVNEMLAVEVDGSQHQNPKQKESDLNKDQLLNEQGWTVLRITAKEILTNLPGCVEKVRDTLRLHQNNPTTTRIGFHSKPTGYQKKVRMSNGLTPEREAYLLQSRKIVRPNLCILVEDVECLGYEGTGRKYGVCGNVIKKWIICYEKYGM